jgi:hypothetical protein
MMAKGSQQGLPRRRRFITAAAPILAVIALGLVLSGCDKCGDFIWTKPASCKGGTGPG